MNRIVLLSVLIQPFILGLTAQHHSALSEEACVKDSSGNMMCGELIPKSQVSTETPTNSEMTVGTESGLKFTLNGCSKLSAGFICSVDVYNSTDFDKTLKYNSYYQFSVTDSEGNTYTAHHDTSSTLGNNQSTSVLPPKLAIKSQIVFKPSGNLTDYIRILRIDPQVDNVQYKVVFRDFQVN